MTATLAILDDNDTHPCVWIGSDSQVTYGNGLIDTTEEKLFEAGGIYFVISGSLCAKGILLSTLEEVRPIGAPCLSISAFATEFNKRMWVPEIDGGNAPSRNFTVILTDGRVIVEIESTMGVYWYREPGKMIAQGSGYEVVLGADFAARVSNRTPYNRAKIALEAACLLRNCCGGPVQLRRVDAGEEILQP